MFFDTSIGNPLDDVPNTFKIIQNNHTMVPIEKYGDIHYKIWCITGSNLDLELWSKLAYCTLDYPFRKLFVEIIDAVKNRRCSRSCSSRREW